MNPITEILKYVYLGEILPSKHVHRELMQFVAAHKNEPKQFITERLHNIYPDQLQDFNTDPKTSVGLAVAYLHEIELMAGYQALEKSFMEGKEVSITEGIKAILAAQDSQTPDTEIPCYSLDQNTLGARKLDLVKVPYGIPLLDQDCKPLEYGDSILVAGRYDMGKSAVCATIADSFLRKDLPVVWFNNESKGSRILSRFRHFAGMEKQLKIYDVHGQPISILRKIIKKEKPVLVIFDTISNLAPTGYPQNSAHKIKMLGVEIRELATEFNLIAVTTAQLDTNAKEAAFPKDSDIEESKTALQAAVDIIILVGGSTYETTRYISIGKNKEGRDPSRRGSGYINNGLFKFENYV